MKFLGNYLFTMLAGGLCYLILPWWSIAVGACVAAFLYPLTAWVNFVSGFLAIAMLWLGHAWWIDYDNNGVLVESINPLLGMRVWELTFIVGGLVGGFAALTGRYGREAILGEVAVNRNRYRNRYR
jgi:hypothetical protein